MLGPLEMDVDECIEANNELAAAVCRAKLTSQSSLMVRKLQPQFNSARLESAVQRVIRQSGVSETDLPNDGKIENFS